MGQAAKSELSLPNTACLDWAERLRRGEMPMALEDLPIASPAAERLSAIFKELHVTDILGKPRVGDLPNHHWIDNAGRALWGGSEITECLVSTAKKQSKTSFGALLYFAAFLAEQTPRQPFNVVAPTTDIAAFSFRQIVGAIDEDEELQRICHVRSHVKEIENGRTGALLKIVPFTKGATGLKGSVLVDEAAVLGKMAIGTALRAQIKGARAASESARILYISTTSEDPPEGSWATLINYARLVRDGRVSDPAFLPCIYEPWKGADPWTDESLWPLLLPSFPHIAGEKFLRNVISEANASGPKAVTRDKAQFFNIEATTYGGGLDSWPVTDLYERIKTDLTLAELIDRAETISVGVDLGGLADLCAICVLGTVGDRWLAWVKCWAMQSAWERNITSRSAFDDFVADGDLDRIDVGEDVAAIVEIASELSATGKMKGIGIDPAGATQLVDALLETEIFGLQTEEDEYPPGIIPIVGVSQSALRMMPALRTSERKAAAGELEIAASRLMGWSLGNVVLVKRGAAVGIDRDLPGAKIDAVAAFLDAVSVHLAIDDAAGFDLGAMIA